MKKINWTDVDCRLALQDVRGSIAHAAMLAATGIISPADGAAIDKGLRQIEQEVLAGQFVHRPEYEDIHMNIEMRLRELIGEAAGRLHTARSRNDQVVTAFRLWLRDGAAEIQTAITELQRALVDQADAHADVVLPGLTHGQPAQPVTFGHHLLAYVEMLTRDVARFADCAARLNECPLGAAALAGTPFAIDRVQTAAALGFAAPMRNSLDAVAARDFVSEYLSAIAISGTHLSRLAEELILWCTPAYGFISLPDSLTTGSSIMPQKRNPDAAELVRAATGEFTGALVNLLMMTKAMPLAYNKDFQGDKKATFAAHDKLLICLEAMTAMVRGLSVNAEKMRAACEDGYLTATDLADWLVMNLNMPFRDAHHVTGRVVALAAAQNKKLTELSLADLQSIEPRITDAVFAVLSVEGSLAARQSLGGTAPIRVREAAAAARERLS
jgi:argininosuccinate lyase